jgi:hypothetical protein
MAQDRESLIPYGRKPGQRPVFTHSLSRRAGKIKWQILEMRGGKGIDITCYDDVTGKNIRVELKHTLSKGSWNHRIEDIDYVVCWENRWPNFPKPVPALNQMGKERK